MDRVRAACADKNPRLVCELLRARLADPQGSGAKTDIFGLLSVEDENALQDLASHLESELQLMTGDRKEHDTLCRWLGRLRWQYEHQFNPPNGAH